MTYKNGKVSINRGALQELYELIRKEKPCPGILICHHPLSEWGDEKTIDEIKHFLFEKLKIRLILSGHRHSNSIVPHRIESNRFIYEVRTGSLSADEEELSTFQLPAFRILKFTKNSGENWQNLKSFVFEYADSKYKPRTDARGNYEESIEIEK